MQNRFNIPHALALKAACWMVVTLGTINFQAQTAQDFSQVKKVFVSPFNSGNGTVELQQTLLKQLRKSGKFEVVAAPTQADAVIRGKGQIWVTGHIAVSPRSPAANSQAVYGGFLSVEVVGADSAVLWSYLVTPGKFSWGTIYDNLAENLVRAMVAAHDKSASPNQGLAQTNLRGAGSTLAAPLYQEWFESFHQRHRDVHIVYDAVGSGLGTQLLAENKVDFAASDVPLSDQNPAPSKTDFLRIASVLGGVVPIYNLRDLSQYLKFTPEALAGIYLGKIKKWNDPIIRDSNKGVALPDTDIVVIHRSDASGTTYTWSEYLSKISEEWRTAAGVGMTLNWPAGTGAERNEGIAAMVQRTPNSIGYVELVYAIQHQLNFGAVRNSSGVYIRASLESVTAAASDTTGNSASPSSITNAPGKDAYPIATFTFLLLPRQVSDAQKKAALLELLRWVLTSGQKECSALGYAPLPHQVANSQLQALDSFK
jgi:phosphate ABC transporter phosphate-binding protein